MVARRALLRVAPAPVLYLAGLAAVTPLPTMARGKRGVVQVALDAANVARSSIPLPNSTANWPVSLPMRALTIDATVRIGVATTTNSEFRRVEAEL